MSGLNLNTELDDIYMICYRLYCEYECECLLGSGLALRYTLDLSRV